MSCHEEEEQAQADVKALPLYETQQGETPHLASMSTQPTAMCQCADHAHHYGHQKQRYQQHASFVGYNWNFFIFHFSFHKANLFANASLFYRLVFSHHLFSMRHLFFNVAKVMLSFHTPFTFSLSFCPLQKPTLSTFTKWTT